MLLETGSEKLRWQYNCAPGLRDYRGLKFLPDGRRIALFRLNLIRVLDSQTGQELRVSTARCASIASLTFQPDGKTLATTMFFDGFIDPTVNIWDVGLPATDQWLGNKKKPGSDHLHDFPTRSGYAFRAIRT